MQPSGFAPGGCVHLRMDDMLNLYDNIPALLIGRPNWVAWGVRGAPLKSPFDPESLLSGRPTPAKAGVRETWGSYKAAVECVQRGHAQGVGYEFDGDGLFGVDLDHVLSDTGVLTPEAMDIVGKLGSYTEISPSGTGLHIFVFAPEAVITRHRKKDHFLEIYDKGRYFTVTGDTYGDRKSIENRNSELQAIHDLYLMPEIAQKVESTCKPVQNAGPERFLQLGLKRDRVFAALWSGERRCGNESADDIAFMNKLAYWCNAEPVAMVSAFLSSPYFAQKDEAHVKKCHRPDYLRNTAENASATAYSTAAVDFERWLQNRKQKSSNAR